MVASIGQRIRRLPRLTRHVGKHVGIQLRIHLPHRKDRGAIVLGVHVRLRGFQQQARFARGGVGRAQFKLRGTIKRDRAQRIGARLPALRGGGNRVVQFRRGRRIRNFREHLRVRSRPGTERAETGRGRALEIIQRIALRQFRVVGARQRRVPGLLCKTPQPVQRVGSVRRPRKALEMLFHQSRRALLPFQNGGPRHAPLRRCGLGRQWKLLFEPRVVARGLVAVELHPIVIPRQIESCLGPMARGRARRRRFHRGHHLRFLLRVAVRLRQRVGALRIHVRIVDLERGHVAGACAQGYAAFEYAQPRALVIGAGKFRQNRGVFRARIVPILDVE